MLDPAARLVAVAPDDADSLATLRVAAMRESLERVGRFDEHRARQRFLATFEPACTQHIVVGENSVGFLVTRVEADHLLLDHLYIHPRHQSRGIGSAVLSLVIAQAGARKLPLRLVALKDSRSNDFYRRHGFTLVAQEAFDNHYEWRQGEARAAPMPPQAG